MGTGVTCALQPIVDLLCSPFAHSFSSPAPWTEYSILLTEMSSKSPGFIKWQLKHLYTYKNAVLYLPSMVLWKMPGSLGREIGGMLQGIETAGRSFWRRPWLKRGCCADDDDDDDTSLPYVPLCHVVQSSVGTSGALFFTKISHFFKYSESYIHCFWRDSSRKQI